MVNITIHDNIIILPSPTHTHNQQAVKSGHIAKDIVYNFKPVYFIIGIHHLLYCQHNTENLYNSSPPYIFCIAPTPAPGLK